MRWVKSNEMGEAGAEQDDGTGSLRGCTSLRLCDPVAMVAGRKCEPWRSAT